ncbi:MAG: Ig-like domain-containing protein [Candidatus Coproplasma sp.]
MNKRRVFITILLAFVLSFVCAFVAACSKKNDDNKNVAVTAVTLNKESVELQLGTTTTVTLTAIVTPDNATDKTVTWTTSAESVATVENGVVTAVGVGTATITATAGGKSDTCAVTVKPAPAGVVAVTGVTLDQTTASLKMGATESVTLTATVAPANATNKAVSWASDNTSVATVDQSGVVTAVSAGTATITVTTADGNKTATCVVTVAAADPVTPENVPVTGVTLDKTTASLKMGATESVTLTATVAPANATNKAVSWASDNTSVATVDQSGVVTAVSAGTATITVTTADGNKTATCVVTVAAADPVTPPITDYTANGDYVLDIENAGATAGIYSWTKGTSDGAFGSNANDSVKYFKISAASGAYDYLYINLKLQAKKIITITGTVRTSNLTDSSKSSTIGISLKSGSTGAVTGLTSFAVTQPDGNKNINLVGNVTTEGTIVLQLSRTAGNTGCELLSFTVTISDPEPVKVESVSLDKTSSALKVGETETLTATVAPADADNKAVTWASSDETVASVVNGVVTAKKAGTATITVTTADGGKTASCAYTITNVAPTSVELNRTTATIAVGDTVNLTATVLPANATIKTVTWKSSDTNIATVDANGVVTAVGVGNVTITATSDDDASVKAECAITIKSTIVYATAIELNHSTADLKVEDTLQLTATITPANTDDKSVTWETSNAAVATVSASGLVTIVGEGTAVITATSNSNGSLTAECTITATYQKYSVTFISEGSNVGVNEVIKGRTTTAPTVARQGYALKGWYESSTFSGTAFDFSTAITKDITLYAKWEEAAFDITYSQGNLESAAIEWSEANAASAAVSYKLASAADTEYVAVDSELIRQVDADTARVDVLGLKGGENYTFKIKSSSGGEATQTLAIKKYDRSGYAHFNYTKGVGAYNDDGTLKDNAIVLYVTDENKNTVTLTYGGITVTGIGNILNTAGMDVGTGLNAKGGTANTNQGILAKLADANIPLVVRFIGCVSDSGLYTKATFNCLSKPLIDGLTIADSIDMGGTAGDNGHMARMKSAKDVTLEGIGEDAVIDGWGFHFMRSTSDKDTERGTSFEVRNLTFINTPEDAIGMEGTQGILSASGSVSGDSSPTSDILGSVERCWVHNNEFYGPSITGNKESDKSEGDGSCDFKRGQYFTCSYNYFEGCHKTNLVGSADSSLQFNLTYHHNYWRFCKARGPLARRANIHMYNNVFEGQTDYAMNTRADCYIYSEYNLFYMCKNPQRVDGGAIKSYNDSFSSCIEGVGTIVTDKNQTVANNCQFSYRNIDYSKFDTNATLSYIPNGNYQLQESVTEARKYIEAFCGVTKRNVKAIEDIDLSEMSYVPSNVTPVNISVPSTVTPGKISKTVYAFTINAAATVTLNATGAVLINEAGECLLTDSGSTVLEPGTYIVQATNFQPGDATGLGQFKDVTITSIAFEEYNSTELNAKLIADYDAKATLVKNATIAYNDESYQLIANAQNAYARLSDELKTQVSVPYSTVTAALATYVDLGETEVETLISAIGTVTVDSGSAISKARAAYQALISVAPAANVSNYAALVAAEEAYESFKVEGLINRITALADPATATTEEAIDSLLAEYQSVQDSYDTLDETQKTQVTNYSKVTEGIATLQAAKAPYTVIDMIEALPAASAVTLSDGTAISAARSAYDALTEAQKTVVGDITKLTEAEAALADLAAATTVAIFTNDDTSLATSVGFTVTGSYKSGVSFEYAGKTYNSPLKLESKTSVTFTTAVAQKMTIKLYSAGGQIKVDGTNYTDDDNDGLIVINSLAAGSHTITKGNSGDPHLCYVILEAVA